MLVFADTIGVVFTIAVVLAETVVFAATTGVVFTATVVLAETVVFADTPVWHPSLRKSAHSSQLVPFAKVHMPYWLPSAAVLISVVPPIAPQLTEAGFAMPAVAAPVVLTGAAVTAGDTSFGTMVVWTVAGVCDCVHPAIRSPAMTQAPRITKIPFLDIIIKNLYIISRHGIKKGDIQDFFVLPPGPVARFICTI